MKPEVLKSWSLEIDYSRAPCLGADQKARGLWERDWPRPLPASDEFPIAHALAFPQQQVTFLSRATQPNEPVCVHVTFSICYVIKVHFSLCQTDLPTFLKFSFKWFNNISIPKIVYNQFNL